MASSNIDVHITEHVTTATTVLSTATIITSSFPHTSVIFSPQQQKVGPTTRSSTGSRVKSTHMKFKLSPGKTEIETTKPRISVKQDIVHCQPNQEKKPPMQNKTTSNSLTALTSEPNIINLHNVENIEEWLKSSKNVYVGRPKVEEKALENEECIWGNPYRLKEYKSRKKVVDLYRAYITSNEKLMAMIGGLHGKVLGCWCSPDQCHAEVLHELAGNSICYEGEASSSTMIQESSPSPSSSSSGIDVSTSPSSTTTTTTTTTTSTTTPAMSSLASSPIGNSISYEDETSPSTKALSPTPSSSSSGIDDSPPPSTITHDINSLVERLDDVEGQLNFQRKYIRDQEDKIEHLEERISHLAGDLTQTKALFSVRDSVIEALRGEIHRLQQYTRRYSVTISGIDRERDENPENPDVLRDKVRKLVTDVNSTTKEEDIDKFHRNGRRNGKEQDIIIRFKSHSAKEAFYKARKNLPKTSNVKIRPSLSNNQVNLLRDAQAVVEDLSLHEEIVNPVEFVFANLHGITQAKLKNKFRGSHFVSFNNVPELIRMIQKAQVLKEAENEFDAISSWADKPPQRKPSSARHSRDSDEDDMGFSAFD